MKSVVQYQRNLELVAMSCLRDGRFFNDLRFLIENIFARILLIQLQLMNASSNDRRETLTELFLHLQADVSMHSKTKEH
jgi:hypothetical protein